MPIVLPQVDPLFSQRSLTKLLKDQIGKMENAIDELSDDVFLQNSPEDLIEAIVTIGYLQPLELHKDKAVSHQPNQIDNVAPNSPVPVIGFSYSIEVPYTGASGLFNHSPETSDLYRPTAVLRSNSTGLTVL